MAATNTVIPKIGAWGGYGANDYDVGKSVSYITKVKLYTGEIVDGMEISYVDDKNHVKTYKVGSRGGGSHEIPLASGEYINRVVGSFTEYYGEICITKLGFKTNLGNNYGPFGQVTGKEFTVEIKGGQIVGFFGQYDRYVNSIGFYLGGTGNSVSVTYE